MSICRVDCVTKWPRSCVTAGTLALCSTPATPGHSAEKRSAPNVVVILADDLGYGDVQCYNPQRGKIPTPNIDRLAAQGMRFTDGHSSSGVCSPSRYTLLTGRYHWRTRLQAGIVGVFGAPLIAPDRLTIAGLLKQHGYRTAAIGKWHLGWDWPIPQRTRRHCSTAKRRPTARRHRRPSNWRSGGRSSRRPIPGGPTTRGFDEYFGTDVPNWPPYCFIENDRTVGIPSALLPAKLLGNNLASLQGPALTGWKLEPILPALGDRACEFIARAAAKPEPFFLYLPLTAPHTPLAVTDEWKGKSGLEPLRRFRDGDRRDGRPRAGCAREERRGRQHAGHLHQRQRLRPYIGAAELEKQGHFPSGPLRGYKADAWEGGHRVPFIVRWPGVVKPGSACDQLVQQADLMATLADILGAKLPANAGEDSFSLLPLLQGGDQPVREHAVESVGGRPAGVRKGPWKLIFGPGPAAGAKAATTSRPQLYNLADDLGETKNLYAENPRSSPN